MKQLSMVQLEFLKILKSFLRGMPYSFPEGFTQLQELYQLAVEHKLASAVYEQIRGDDLLRQEQWRELDRLWKKTTIREVMLQTQRADGFLRVYQALLDKGVRPLVMKGMICRNLYQKPDYRVSGDEDILIQKEDFQICDAVFLASGFQRDEVDIKHLPHEISYIHPKNGVYIELHTALFPEENSAYGHLNSEFSNVFVFCTPEHIQGTKIWTMEPTRHLFYLICHSFKHFLHGGFGIRQLCDIVMFSEHYGKEIDWTDIADRTQRLRMKSFWNGLVSIGREFFDFSPLFPCCAAAVREDGIDHIPLLLDILQSGIYGGSTVERKHSSNITLAAMESGKKSAIASLRASLFPPYGYMKVRFRWLNKCPWLLPIAYGIRLLQYLTRPRESQSPNTLQLGTERVALLKQYNIID